MNRSADWRYSQLANKSSYPQFCPKNAQVLRPAGRTTAYAYDPAGRLAEVVHNATERTRYHYDAAGQLREATAAGSTVQWERDALGRVLREVQNSHEVATTYDTRGLRQGLTSSLGAAISFERDVRGRVRRTQAGAAWQSAVERDAEGLELHRQLSGGLRTGWQRDALGRPTGQRVSAGGHEHRRRYQWQGADQLLEVEDSQHGTSTFAYDPLGNLAGAAFPGQAPELRQPDAVGNLFRTRDRTDRRYGPGGQLQEANGTRYQYDEEGNLTRKTLPTGQQWHYAWDGAGQLAQVTRPDGYAVTFAYDALGRRVSKRFRGRVTRWVWDGDKPLHEWHELEIGPGAGTAQDLATWLFDEDSFAPAAKLTAQQSYSVVCDHLGTPLAMYDGQGQPTWAMVLDSYGAVRQGKGKPQDCPFRYQGQYEDTETGLYYNRFRYYDPESGQYISQDPIGLESRVYNFYAYTADPNATIDPYGLDWNYVLVDKTGKTYYAGRASDNQSMADVARRHGNNAGTDGARFGETDTMRRVTKPGSDADMVRGIEQRGVAENPLLGRKSPLRRGNLIDGISEAKRSTIDGKVRLAAADAHLNGRKVSELPSLSELKLKPCPPV